MPKPPLEIIDPVHSFPSSSPSKKPFSIWCFSLTIVRLGHRFLLVKEAKHGHTWYLPAGRLELGEDFQGAACREVLEETGVPVILEGITRYEFTARNNGQYRQRITFVARPQDDTPPRIIPNLESLEARWFTLDEIKTLPLRGSEVIHILEKIHKGAPIYPLTLLSKESLF